MKPLAGIFSILVVIFANSSAIAATESYNCSLHSGEGPQSVTLTMTATKVFLNGIRAPHDQYNLFKTSELPGGWFQLEMYSSGPILRRTAGTWFTYYCNRSN